MMNRWKGKVAVVTGASAGIGQATVKTLAEYGLTVVGLARRKAQMEVNMKNFEGPGKFYPRECDVTKKEDVGRNLDWVRETFKSIDVLINNAGVSKVQTIQESSTEDLEKIFDVNVMGVFYCTKKFMEIYEENEIKRDSHIININSTLGHWTPTIPQLNVYPATKYAIRNFSDTLRLELQNTKIRVTNLSPGTVKTPMLENAAKKMPGLMDAPALTPEELADTIIYVLGLPAHIEINELIVQARAT